MRYEVPEDLPFSRELKLYLMKRAPRCDADLEQHQVTHDFYTERGVGPLVHFVDASQRRGDSISNTVKTVQHHGVATPAGVLHKCVAVSQRPRACGSSRDRKKENDTVAKRWIFAFRRQTGLSHPH